MCDFWFIGLNIINHRHKIHYVTYFYIVTYWDTNLVNIQLHSSEKRGLRSTFFVQRNASKFAIFIEKENPRSFFHFSFRAFLSFTL